MRKEDFKELHYITHIDNLLSILENGILCYEKSKKLHYKSIANQKVQKRRAKMVIPGGKKITPYDGTGSAAKNSTSSQTPPDIFL